MKKKVIFALITTMILTIGIMTFGNSGGNISAANISAEEALISSFKSSGAQVMESTISCWAKINNVFLTQKQVTAEAQTILKALDLEDSVVESIVENNEGQNKQITYAVKDEKTYTIAVESLIDDSKGQTYAIIDLSMDAGSKDLAIERQKLEALFKGKEDTLKINSCIIGTFDGQLTQNEMREKVNKALKVLGAKKVEGLEQDEMISISAYTSSIKEYIKSGNKKVNIQAAVRYSSYDDKTYIWLGSPIIPVNY